MRILPFGRSLASNGVIRMRFNEFKLRQWEEEHIKKFPKRIRAYDVVIEVKNIQAENEEEAKRQALDLITSPFSADIKIEAFEKARMGGKKE